MTDRSCKKCLTNYDQRSRKCKRTGLSRSPWDGMCVEGQELYIELINTKLAGVVK